MTALQLRRLHLWRILGLAAGLCLVGALVYNWRPLQLPVSGHPVNDKIPVLKHVDDDHNDVHNMEQINIQQMIMRKFQPGLSFSNGQFVLGGKNLRLFSGAMHYFRVVPEYWKQRLLLLKAANLNAVETYVPWNLHEEIQGEFNFEGILNIRKFIQTAKEVGLHVILRPGPFICAEWDFGGLPSWLLHDPEMKVRSMYQPYLDAVDAYFNELFAEVSDLQYSNGGPIIAMQIENEYGSYGSDQNYMMWLRETMWKHGVKELLFTSDNKHGLKKGGIPGVLMTANFKTKEAGKGIFQELRVQQPDAPLMVMEFWTGWFDHWGEQHHTWKKEIFEETLQFILDEGASVNFFMFHGGTNFGFMNGANMMRELLPTVTSYDYDAPITESGQLTDKYEIVKRLLQPYVDAEDAPVPVDPIVPHAYGMLEVTGFLKLDQMLPAMDPIESSSLVSMESLNINKNGGQGYGFILYRKRIPSGQRLKISGHVRDRAMVILDAEMKGEVGKWSDVDSMIDLQEKMQASTCMLDILVENLGRVNYGAVLNDQRKGLVSPLSLDGKDLHDWLIYPLEFKKDFLLRLKELKWHTHMFSEEVTGPGLYSATLTVSGEPRDTFLDMQGWKKGVVFVNSFNIGRYWIIGPQQTLYVPAPLLKTGDNEILVFELYNHPGKFVDSTDKHILAGGSHSLTSLEKNLYE